MGEDSHVSHFLNASNEERAAAARGAAVLHRLLSDQLKQVEELRRRVAKLEAAEYSLALKFPPGSVGEVSATDGAIHATWRPADGAPPA